MKAIEVCFTRTPATVPMLH